MSRTYRRTKNDDNRWNGKNWAISEYNYNEYGVFSRMYFDKQSVEYARRIAKYHSDAGTHSFKEPGPSWFRNLYSQRPLRRQSRVILQRFVQGEDFDVIINENPKLPYWT